MRQWYRRVFLVGTLVACFAIIYWPDYCEDAPDWLRYILGCECSTSNCSGAG